MRHTYDNVLPGGVSETDSELEQAMRPKIFDPFDFIEILEDGYALCTNPMVDGGLSAITINTHLAGETLKNFEGSIKRMVLAKLFSPKFGEVILTATRLRSNH